MTIDLLLGLQWGDEGKGKIVDVLTSKYDIIARFQGGPNAGHTLEFDGIKHVLRAIPSGIFHKTAVNIIGNGVVIDPVVFQKEIEGLEKFNIDIKSKLIISSGQRCRWYNNGTRSAPVRRLKYKWVKLPLWQSLASSQYLALEPKP